MIPSVFCACSRFHTPGRFRGISLLPTILLLGSLDCPAKGPIRSSFFDVYPSAVGTAIDTVPSNSGHCGLCHYDFGGGGPRNPYGLAIQAYFETPDYKWNSKTDRETVINLVAGDDQDGDGFSTLAEIDVPAPNRNFGNTPTFPGLSAAFIGSVSNVDITEIQDYLKPSGGIDTDPPSVTLDSLNSGETVTANTATTVNWTAGDPSGIASIHIYLSLDGGTTFLPVELGLPNSGSFSWIPANRPSTTALIRVVAVDAAANPNSDDSEVAFTIISPAGGTVPTTLRDFDMPGSQPFEALPEIEDPGQCASCHGDYDADVEPHSNWQGSMMAHASIDPLFLANLSIANQDAPESGDLCLRCHFPRGWLGGRSVPTDGSRMLPEDEPGVSCEVCHRMVDPVYKPGISPAQDADILAALGFPGTEYGNGMMVIDPTTIQRGPFADAEASHAFVSSPFHSESAFCGTCHDVSNPAFTKDGEGIYQPNPFDSPAADFSPHTMAPVERTYSEWLNSEYASTGVYQPEFAGNKTDGVVSSCQDCHMRDVEGVGCNQNGVPIRPDLPLHDMTGGSTWIASLLPALHPDAVDATAIQAGIARARTMLQNAADLEANVSGGGLVVRVTNQTGHKLPTGYPEGRRIWVNVRFFGAGDTLLDESCGYDPATGELDYDHDDPEDKVYEVHPGIGPDLAAILNGTLEPGDPGYIEPGPSLHFVLNNEVYKDNRIPPRGFDNAAFAAFGGAPVHYSYSNGQHWDDTTYTIPAGTSRAEVTLYYQSTSKEFIEFLRDENTTDTKGQEMYDLWVNHDRCPPEQMAATTWTAPTLTFGGLGAASAGIESATLSWSAATSGNTVTYKVYHSVASGAQDFDGPPLRTTQDLSIEVSSLDPGSTSRLTHYFVVRAVDELGGSEANIVELSVQPLLDGDKDQDGDGLWNSFETQYSFDPFNPDDALQDPDKDGMTSLEECAFGSDPTLESSANRPKATQVEDGGVGYFAVSYIRSQAAGIPLITAEVSGDLVTWNSGSAFTEDYSVVSNGDGTDTVVVRTVVPVTDSDRDFIRLRITPN